VAPTSKGMKSLVKVFAGLSQVLGHAALGILQDGPITVWWLVTR
jgi:hypothetical protein